MNFKEFKAELKNNAEFKININQETIDYKAYLPEKGRKPILNFKYLSLIMTVLILGFFTFLIYRPVSYVNLEINPQISFKLNTFNRVIKIEANNSDGEELIDQVNFTYKKIDEAMDLIYEYSKEENWTVNNNLYVVLDISTKNSDKYEYLKNTIIEDETGNIKLMVVKNSNEITLVDQEINIPSIEAGGDYTNDYSSVDSVENELNINLFAEDMFPARVSLVTYIFENNDEFETLEDLEYLFSLSLDELYNLYN